MTRFVDAHNDYEKIANFAENLNEKINYKSKAVVCLYRNNDIKAGDEEAKTFEKEFKDLENKNYYKYLFLLEKGKAYYKNKDLNEASKIFETVTKEGEKEEIAPEAELYIGLIYQSKNNQVEALKYYSSIQTKYPNAKIWDKIYNTLGFYYYGIGQFPEAAKYFRMAIENSPSKKVDRYALNNLILSYRYSEWIDSELSALRRYVNLFPDADDILQKKIDIGIAMVNIGNFKEAIEYLKPLFTEATLEKEVDIQMQIAMAYEGLGNNEKAISEWLKVLYYGRSEVPKLDIYVKYRLAEICEKVGLYDKSMKFYEEIIEKEGAASDLGKPAQKGLERVRERIDTIGGQKNIEKIK
jgi:tetratricopeptide (TPR) repeat protein